MKRRDIEIRQQDGNILIILARAPEPLILGAIAREEKYQVAGVFKRLGISDRQLRRIFQAGMGISPKNWLRQQQMVDARNLLRNGGYIKETAFEVGFNSSKTFSREFQVFHGMTPTEFQEKMALQNLDAQGITPKPISPATRKKIISSTACQGAPATGCPFQPHNESHVSQ